MHCLKTLAPILFKVEGNDISFKSEQYLKASLPILVTDDRIDAVVKFEHPLKALVPIDCMEFAEILVNPDQLRKELLPIDVMLLLIVKLLTFVLGEYAPSIVKSIAPT